MEKILDELKKITELGKTLEPAKAEQLKKIMAPMESKVVQFKADEGENCYIQVKEGVASAMEGTHPSPAFTMKGPEEVLRKVLTRELDPTKAFMTKQYTIEGSLADAMNYGRIALEISKLTKGE